MLEGSAVDTFFLFSLNIPIAHNKNIFNINSTFLDKKKYKSKVNLNDIQKDILIGTILGDSSIEKRGRFQNARLRFDQTFPDHATYLMYIYSQFTNLAGKGPKVYIRKPDKRTNKIYSSMQFKTLAFPCLNYYYDLFYKEGKKIIPSNISQLLTKALVNNLKLRTKVYEKKPNQ
jgi:hypothetical protein